MTDQEINDYPLSGYYTRAVERNVVRLEDPADPKTAQYDLQAVKTIDGRDTQTAHVRLEASAKHSKVKGSNWAKTVQAVQQTIRSMR